jgi:hypothetical protein
VVRTHDSTLVRVVDAIGVRPDEIPLGYHARVCDLVSQIISSYSTSLQHSPHSKNALRILLKLPLRLTLASLSLCSAHPASHSSAQHFSPGLTQAHPFSFSPTLHPILYLISAVHLRQGPTLRHCVVRCPLSILAHQASGPGVRCMWSHLRGYQRVAPLITGATAV